jgi:DNA polymerase I-like protein with 3'-5' exonuclease and polymerase domains
VPGTTSGRLAGSGGLNVQQMPKTPGFLACWRARPGYKLVELDFTALEQVVLTELSKDPGLWKLYGPGQPGNDAYLYAGAHLPILGPAIRAAGYDPERPTPEGIAHAKKVAKRERGIAKVVVLASSYGAGAKKIHQTLTLGGIELKLSEAQAIHRGYWDLYAGVKRYERELQRQLENNGGWFLNGIGRPLGIADGYERDAVNRACQSTGHDCLVLYLGIVAGLLRAAGIDWHPWLLDLHDETFLEVREDQAAAAAAVLEGPAMQKLNALLGGVIPLRGGAEIAENMAEIKCAT